MEKPSVLLPATVADFHKMYKLKRNQNVHNSGKQGKHAFASALPVLFVQCAWQECVTVAVASKHGKQDTSASHAMSKQSDSGSNTYITCFKSNRQCLNINTIP